MTTRMFHSIALLLGLFCIVFLQGCGGSSVAGTYELDKEAVRAAAKAEIDKQAAAEGEDEGMAAFAATMVLGMIEQMSMTMTLNEDGTATMVVSGMDEPETMTGTWTLDGNNITITASKDGEPEEPASGTFDGDTITLHPEEGEDMPFDLVFKKKV